VLEYWNIGVLGVIQTELYKPPFRQPSGMMICSVSVIGQKKIMKLCVNLFDHPTALKNDFFHYFMTPILLRLNSNRGRFKNLRAGCWQKLTKDLAPAGWCCSIIFAPWFSFEQKPASPVSACDLLA